MPSRPKIFAVCSSPDHGPGKNIRPEIELIQGLGTLRDAHYGRTVQHRSRVKKDPTQPNLRQVHLLHIELLNELKKSGFPVAPGILGENITTQGVDLLRLPRGTHLKLGKQAIVEVTGLRNPCVQIDSIAPGLMEAVLDRDEQGKLVRLAGIMGIVIQGGTVRAGEEISILRPELPHLALEPV